MTGNNHNRLRILAVDDHQAVLTLYREALSIKSFKYESEFDYDVVLCDQGDKAVDAVRETIDREDPFAVVFLDLKLPPGPDGLWTGEQIRKLDPYVNFVIVTGMPDVDPREISLRIPPEDKLLYVQKPFHIQELRQFAAALGAKWQSETLLRKARVALEEKVMELEHSRINLLDNQLKLENVNNQLMETNDALSVLARNLDRTRKESERQVLEKTRTLIIPIIERLQQGENFERYKTELNLLVGYVENLNANLGNDIKMAASLSTTELRIASMIKNGMSSEEIAKHLYISSFTVKTHRKNIRRKLNIQNSGVNLRAYLESEMGEAEP
jgi:DNA-binding NarL/FixJ family response regulator